MRWSGRSPWIALLALALGATPADAAPTAEERIRALEEALRRTQEEVLALREELRRTKTASGTPAPAAERAKAAPVKPKAEAAGRPGWIEKTTLFGDVRLRHEGFYHQPHAAGEIVTARNRERIRARLGLRYVHGDEVSATVRIATGDPDDPVSTNESLGDVFDRKHVNLDWAFLTVTPGETFGLRPGLVSVTAGKFPNPMFRVAGLVFDDDLAPEGFAETFKLLAAPWGSLEQVKVHLQQWTFDEVANGTDGWMFGGQIDPTARWGSTRLELGLGQYWWLEADRIAQALNENDELFNSNRVRTVVEDGETVVTGYAGDFNMTNVTAQATVPDVLLGKELRLFADFVHNWEAAGGANSLGWLAGARLGRAMTRGDWSVYGFYQQLEREAAISSFTESDFGFGGTNVEGPVVGLEYQLFDPLTVSAKSYFVNQIDRTPGRTNPTLTRLQLDALLKF